MGECTTKVWQCSNTERYLLHRTGNWERQGNHPKREKHETSDGSSDALYDGNKKALEGAAGNCSKKDHRIQQKDKVCMYRGSSSIHEKAFGIHSSWKPCDHIAVKKGFNSVNHFSLVHKKYSERQLQLSKNGRSSNISQRGNWTKMKAKRRSFDKHREKKKVHFVTLMDICHLLNAE